nr:RING-H2 finger protein ATL40-like [Ipomoea batatas]
MAMVFSGVELPPLLSFFAIASVIFVYLVICCLILEYIGENGEPHEEPLPADDRFSGLSYEDLQEMGCFYHRARSNCTASSALLELFSLAIANNSVAKWSDRMRFSTVMIMNSRIRDGRTWILVWRRSEETSWQSQSQQHPGQQSNHSSYPRRPPQKLLARTLAILKFYSLCRHPTCASPPSLFPPHPAATQNTNHFKKIFNISRGK